jgi:glycosyltransferase involved in cell wall biosynthesis
MGKLRRHAVTSGELHIVVPGPLDQVTGGYVYDAHMVEGLRERGWGVRVHNLPGRFPDADEVARKAMADALASIPEGARVVIDGLAMGGMPVPIEAHAPRLRIVSLVHHPLSKETGLPADEAVRLFDTERRALAACAGIIVSSAYTARGLVEFGVPEDRVRVVVPGTDRPSPASGPGPGEPPMLLCVASVTPRKGHEVLVDALARARDLEWTCVCAGGLDRDPDQADRVLRAVAKAGLDGRVTFVGERRGEELDELYRSASAFVLASYYEGYGMALADALAHGLPVVSTTGGAIPFTVPAEAGILAEPGNPVAFAAALRALLTPGSTVGADLALAARRHALRLPSWSDSVGAFAAAVQDLTG